MKRSSYRSIKLLILIFAVFIIAVAVTYYFVEFPDRPSSSRADWGALGDYFGGTLNPVLAFLGLIALLITISIQSEELSISTDELAKSAQALRDQHQSQKRQTFESTFFAMVHLHHDLVRSLSKQEWVQKPLISGRDVFRIMFEEFTILHGAANSELQGQGQIKIAHQAYMQFFQKFENDVGHYFRNFYCILKFVDESEVEHKDIYTSILRAQLSAYEQVLLFYNVIHPIGHKLLPLIVRYEMLENFNTQNLRNPPDEVFLIDRRAYGEQDLSRYDPCS